MLTKIPTRSNQVINKYRVLGFHPSGSFVVTTDKLYHFCDTISYISTCSPNWHTVQTIQQSGKILSTCEIECSHYALHHYIKFVLGIRDISSPHLYSVDVACESKVNSVLGLLKSVNLTTMEFKKYEPFGRTVSIRSKRVTIQQLLSQLD